mmetsp:Transcript_29066/g.46409  ORF Transcript_29066/g.46409 Transcript_29066/m.46409 type:complete len:100 (-) Transcript_29066:54-353(-)
MAACFKKMAGIDGLAEELAKALKAVSVDTKMDSKAKKTILNLTPLLLDALSALLRVEMPTRTGKKTQIDKIFPKSDRPLEFLASHLMRHNPKESKIAFR